MGRQTLYVNAEGATRIHQSGFSWFAACFFPVWAVRHRLYWTAAASALFGGLLGIASMVPPLTTMPWLRMAIGAAIGISNGVGGPLWQRFLLRRAGYRAAAAEPE